MRSDETRGPLGRDILPTATVDGRRATLAIGQFYKFNLLFY